MKKLFGKLLDVVVTGLVTHVMTSGAKPPKRKKPTPSAAGTVAQSRKDTAMNTPMGGVIRHILTAAGGFMVAMGYMDEAMMTEVIGAVSTLAGLLWSILAKKTA